MKENRSLRRIDNTFGSDLKAIVYYDNTPHEREVLNYNSLGVSIKIQEDDSNIINIQKVELIYGKAVISEFVKPKLVRKDLQNKNMIISFSENDDGNLIKKEREDRAEFAEVLQGSAITTDPFTIDQALIFKVANISEKGVRLTSSKSNRHLTPGLVLKNVDIMLPGYGIFKTDIKIKNVNDENNKLNLGCEFLKKSKEQDSILDKIVLTTNKLVIPSNYSKELRSKIKKVKKFGNRIRVRRLSSEEEYEKVLYVRFNAYKAANKVKDGMTLFDMKDQYDEHAIIYAAFIGPNIVGTIRLVFRNNGNKLPLEEYFDISKISEINPDETVEISRFAIDPHFQGTDLFFALFRKNMIEMGMKQIKYPVCLATGELAPYYRTIGAKEISEPVPHPTLPNTFLTLFLFNPDNIARGKTSALGWFFITKPAKRIFNRFGLHMSRDLSFLKLFLLPIELLRLKLAKKRK